MDLLNSLEGCEGFVCDTVYGISAIGKRFCVVRKDSGEDAMVWGAAHPEDLNNPGMGMWRYDITNSADSDFLVEILQEVLELEANENL